MSLAATPPRIAGPGSAPNSAHEWNTRADACNAATVAYSDRLYTQVGIGSTSTRNERETHVTRKPALAAAILMAVTALSGCGGFDAPQGAGGPPEVGNALSADSIREAFRAAYPDGTIADISVLAGECMNWGSQYESTYIVEENSGDGQICYTGSQVNYDTSVRPTAAASTPVDEIECLELRDTPDSEGGTFDLGKYYCMGDTFQIMAFYVEQQNDNRVKVNYVLLESWNLDAG